MRAVRLDGSGRPRLDELPDPIPGPGEALLDVRVAGICGTDLELSRGYMGFSGVPGHEFVATVAQVTSPADRPLLGARVAGEINLGCQRCALCAQGMSRHCVERRVLGILGHPGAHAERLALPIANLRAVPAALADEEAVFIEPLAAACEILDQVPLAGGERVLVMGDGRLGLLAAQVLHLAGARVTLAGHHTSRLDLARFLGMEGVRAPEGLPAERFDITVEATGSPGALDSAVRMTRPRGTVVMKSTCAGATTFDAARAVVDEITLIGSRCGRFEPAIRLLAEGRISVRPLLEGSYPLDRAVEAYAHAGRPGALKIQLRVAA